MQSRLQVRAFVWAVLAVAVTGWPALAQAFEPRIPAEQVTLEIAFTPGDDAAQLIVETIATARWQILVQAFSFTNRYIVRALIKAKSRGVDVEVLADAGETAKIAHGAMAELARAGVPVYLDDMHAAAHNKLMVIDEAKPTAALITGSYNFTYAAQNRNAENMLVIRSGPRTIGAYADNWRLHRSHSRPYRTQ